MEGRSFLLMKLGFALVVPLAGFIFSYFNSSTCAEEAEEEDGCEVERSCRASTCYASNGCGRGLKYELFLMQNEVGTTNLIHRALLKPATMSTDNTTSNIPKRSEDDGGGVLRLPAATISTDNIGSNFKRSEREEKGVHCLRERETVCGRPANTAVTKDESEIQYLRNLAQSLWDSNRILSSVRELENKLKVSSEENLSLSLKIDNLKGENERLKAGASELSSEFFAMRGELESSKSKVKELKRRLKDADEQAKEKIASLEHRIILLAEVDLQNKMIAVRLKELEDEAAGVREEKAILEQRLESADLSIFALEDSRAEVSKERDQLREVKSNLEKTIEQLHSDRSAQYQELVYLRKKQKLILQYAEEWSSSPESQCQSDICFTTSTASRDTRTAKTRKSKFMDKFKKLVLRKGGSSRKSKISPTPELRFQAFCDAEEEEAARRSRCSFDSNVSCFTEQEEEEEEEDSLCP